MWILKVCTRIKPKVLVPWHYNSVSEAIILLPKNFSKSFTKTMFSLRDIIKIVSDQQLVIPTQTVISVKNLDNLVSSLNNRILLIGKIWSEDS